MIYPENLKYMARIRLRNLKKSKEKNFNHERTTIYVNVIVNKMPKDILFSLMDVRRSFWMVKIAAYRRSIWISMILRNG